MNYWLNGPDCRIEMRRKISKTEDRSIEMIQYEKHREKTLKDE